MPAPDEVPTTPVSLAALLVPVKTLLKPWNHANDDEPDWPGGAAAFEPTLPRNEPEALDDAAITLAPKLATNISPAAKIPAVTTAIC